MRRVEGDIGVRLGMEEGGKKVVVRWGEGRGEREVVRVKGLRDVLDINERGLRMEWPKAGRDWLWVTERLARGKGEDIKKY